MKKIEVEFETDFESTTVLPIQLGRLLIGPYVARLMFHPDGQVRMYIDRRAVTDGYVSLYEQPADALFGFGKASSKT